MRKNEYLWSEGLTKFKGYVSNKTNVAQMMIPVFNRIENTVVKGEKINTSY